MLSLRRARWLWFSFGGLLLLGFAVFAWRFFTVIRPTPFSADVTATSITFVSPGDPAPTQDARDQVPAATPLGLLASSRLVTLNIQGCDFIEPQSGGTHQEFKDLTLRAEGVQLSHVTLSKDTLVWLHVSQGGLSLVLRQDGPEPSSVSFTWPKGSKNVGEWRIHPRGKLLTIDLIDDPGNPFELVQEEAHPIAEGSSVRLDPDLHAADTLNVLHLPDLPKEFWTTQIGEGPMRVNHLQKGELRHLTVVREKDSPKAPITALRATLTGSSDDIGVYDRYENAPRNQALTGFDANSGKDRKLRMIALFFLGAAGLGLLSTLLGVTLHGFELVEVLRGRHKTAHPHKTSIEEPDAEAFEAAEQAASAEAVAVLASAKVEPTDD